ncbi:hypothetical protein F511_10020 [Dorcoceras hygrometricum]|uniref:Vacuolar protein sorting-associated protein 62 n=1 Tax=Dorcoceras hygrometricum TaxID=472368 RepID=A0A2Z7CEY5_9LAMI|nr:hypothetical protein F511_10020 [Dorcoceras hygrometricum]
MSNFTISNWVPMLQGGGFGRGVIDIGGLQLLQISSFKKIWATYTGGPDDLGVTFFEPSPIPDGFSMLGSYAQPNNRPLFGWVMVGKSDASDPSGQILKSPIEYTQVWINSSKPNGQEDSAYFWLPKPPDGYKAVGYVITSSPDKPSLDKIRCVRADFTDEFESDNLIWTHNGLNINDLRPQNRGLEAQALGIGTLSSQENDANDTSSSTTPLSRLKNKNSNLSSTPNLSQVEELFKTYAPYIYFHPDEIYLPSSVNWYFSNGALLYTKGEESKPVPIDPDGSNLPQGGSNDGAYWLDLPIDEQAKERVKKGDLQTAEAYIHIKPVLGATFTDIQVWLFYPFNGHATAKIGFFRKISLGKIGEHVGDWEHLTLRISNFDGALHQVYFSEHSGGRWVDSSALEFQSGNKFVGYSSLNGHASYSSAGLFLQGSGNIGLRNEAAKSGMVMDTGSRFSVVSAAEEVAEPPWLNYAREWGPKLNYDFGKELRKVEKLLPGKKLHLLPSVDLRSTKVCELGLLNYKAKHVFYSFKRKRYRCHYDYYWASIFKVEYVDHSGQARFAFAEAPNEALPSECRPNFGAAWLTKDKFKVNETYQCWYTLGISKVSMNHKGLFDCQAQDPSTVEMLKRYFMLIVDVETSHILSKPCIDYFKAVFNVPAT